MPEPFGQISEYTSLQQGSTEYIRENFPLFLQFMQAYFAWMEENQSELSLGPIQGIFSLLDQRNIDTVLPQFLQYFFFEYLYGLPTTMLADPKKLAKHIKDFYLSRGSEGSFKLLFQILYDDLISFYYPKIDVIRPSDGHWSVDTIIRTTTPIDTLQYISRKIIGVTSGATANVENVILLQIGSNVVSEMYISSLQGNFQIGESLQIVIPEILNVNYFVDPINGNDTNNGLSVTTAWKTTSQADNILLSGTQAIYYFYDDTWVLYRKLGMTMDEMVLPLDLVTFEFSSLILPTLYGLATGIDIENQGTAYKPEDIITVTGGNQTAIFSVNIISGTLIGRVVPVGTSSSTIQLASNSSGVDGYYDNMYITLTDGTGANQENRIISYVGATQIATLNTDWITTPDITTHYSINLGNIQTVKAKDFGINYTTPIAANFTLAGNGNATGTITVGAVGQYAGRYVDDSGFLSCRKYIQDSYFYQDFSYVLRTHEQLSEYINIIKQVLHPAGLLLFGDLIIDGISFTPPSGISGIVTIN
jgi:hypothetical protein